MNQKMFYVWVFVRQAEDFVPVAVFNTREEGDHHLARLKREDNVESGGVLEQTFEEFRYQATNQRLGQIAPQIERLLAVIEDKPVGTAVTQDGRVVSLYGKPAFPIAVQKL